MFDLAITNKNIYVHDRNTNAILVAASHSDIGWIIGATVDGHHVNRLADSERMAIQVATHLATLVYLYTSSDGDIGLARFLYLATLS